MSEPQSNQIKQVQPTGLEADVRISLPMEGGRIDFDLISRAMSRRPGVEALKALLKKED